MDKCRYCGLRGLVLSTAAEDYSCEHCGEWQNAILNSAWEITGHSDPHPEELEGVPAVYCGDCLTTDCAHLK